jgi:hypothetical protein
VYTDTNFLRDDPEGAVRTLERVLSQYPPDELTNEVVWIEQWLVRSATTKRRTRMGE